MDNRGMDTDVGWINRKFRELERAVEGMRSERRAGATTVGGGNWVIDGGDVLMLDTDGSVIFRLGTQTHGDRGVTVSREDGTVVLTTAKQFSNDTVQRWSLRDTAANTIVSETTFGDGLERPHLSIPLQPVGPAGTAAPPLGPYGPEVAVTSGTFVDAFRWQGSRQNRWYRPIFNVRFSDTTTAAEVRVVNGAGAVLAGFLQPTWTAAIAAGSTADAAVPPPYGLGLSDAFLATQVVRAQARRTAGAGIVHVSVRESQGGPA